MKKILINLSKKDLLSEFSILYQPVSKGITPILTSVYAKEIITNFG
jgi:hypothetical protein